jgi:hypothetical protein
MKKRMNKMELFKNSINEIRNEKINEDEVNDICEDFNESSTIPTDTTTFTMNRILAKKLIKICLIPPIMILFLGLFPGIDIAASSDTVFGLILRLLMGTGLFSIFSGFVLYIYTLFKKD